MSGIALTNASNHSMATPSFGVAGWLVLEPAAFPGLSKPARFSLFCPAKILVDPFQKDEVCGAKSEKKRNQKLGLIEVHWAIRKVKE